MVGENRTKIMLKDSAILQETEDKEGKNTCWAK